MAAVASPAAPATGSAGVVFDIVDSNASTVLCAPDNASYRLRGRLVWHDPRPRRGRRTAAGSTCSCTTGTGGWFWNLRNHPAYDYATRLAERGETSGALDRPGTAPRGWPTATPPALGAQVDMLHQVVQHLVSGPVPLDRPAARHDAGLRPTS